jgi:hypothetical protein
MKQYFRTILFLIISALILVQANGQVKTNKKKKVEKVEEIEPPPPQEELKVVEIDMAGADTIRTQPKEGIYPGVPVPQVDFDTTAVPNDSFTKDILRLLTVTNAINLGVLFANNMPKEYENNEQLKELYKRLIKDVESGVARRWVERAYVREYRNRFTPQDITELINFYESPIGKKLISVTYDLLPGVMNQGKNIGAYRGTQLYVEMMKENSGK